MLNNHSPKFRENQTFLNANWLTGCQAVTANKLWQYCLIAIGSASSLVYSHAPLVSFATLAGITLNHRQAIASALLIWLVNQFYGFTVRHYPLSAIAFLWGISMGIGTIVVTLIASVQPEFSRRSWLGQSAWVGIALVLGFAVYGSSALLVNQWVGMHGLTADVFLRMFVRDGIWAISLFTLHTLFVLIHQQRLRRSLH